MKLVVTGAGGGLGRAFLEQVPAGHDVVPLTRTELDVADHGAVMGAVPALKPDAVLHFGAMTAVDGCELDPEQAYRVNGLGPHSLALAARACGAILLHVSTDYVFDGEKGTAYDEMDRPNPVSAYGRSKLAGESKVRAMLPEHFVVRTSYVFGGGTDYVTQAIAALERGEAAGGLVDRVGSPTFVRHLAARILPLVLTERFGTYHVCGSESGSWHDVLARARSIAGLPGEVRTQTSEELARPAARPGNSSMVSLFTKELGLAPMPPFDVALKEMLDGRGH
ncbi:MAG: dTDP-4-dehydrorhamnose reductase [Actinomycetota bacterium]